jgi:hypothetical protein
VPLSAPAAPDAAAPPISQLAPPPVTAPRPAAPAYSDRRPGAVPLRPLAVGELLDAAMTVIRAHPGPTLGLGAIVMTAQMALTLPVHMFTQSVSSPILGLSGGGSASTTFGIAGLLISYALAALITTLCGGVASAFAAVTVGEAVLGRPISAGSVWRQVRPRLWAVAGLSLILGIASGIGALALGIGWLFVLVVAAVAMPVLLLEHAGILTALKRSWQLTITSFGRVLLIRLLAVVIATLLTMVLGGLFSAAGQLVLTANPDADTLLQFAGVFLIGLGEMSAGLVVVPFLGCVEALLYIDRRMRAEGLDIELGHQARTAPAAFRGQ